MDKHSLGLPRLHLRFLRRIESPEPDPFSPGRVSDIDGESSRRRPAYSSELSPANGVEEEEEEEEGDRSKVITLTWRFEQSPDEQFFFVARRIGSISIGDYDSEELVLRSIRHGFLELGGGGYVLRKLDYGRATLVAPGTNHE